MIDYSQAGEPRIFRRYLPKLVPRFLVEVGAGDGLTGSLSREFVDEGWSVMLIEADADAFFRLQANYHGISHVHCVRVSCSNYDDFSVVQPRTGAPLAAGVNATSDGIAGVCLRRLTTILAEHRMPRDLGILILNIAASAVDVMQGFDPDRFCVGLIVTRDEIENIEECSRKYDLLCEYGYKYAGLAGEHSIWCLGSGEVLDYKVSKLKSVTPELPERETKYVAFDPLPDQSERAIVLGGADIMLSGWAFFELTAPVPPLVFLEILDQRSRASQYIQAHRCRRADVSAHFHQPNLVLSGFRALVPVVGRRPGPIRIRVVQADAEARYHSNVELLLESSLQEYERTTREGLARKFLSGSGIEIGALQRRLKLPAGCRIRYIDRMSLKDLLRHYPELNGMPIQAPDLIDNGETLFRIADASQDFVIANHFLEHCENPIETLSNLLRVVRSGGILFLAIPDKTYTFDFDRPATDYDVLKTTYEKGSRFDRENLYEEWVKYVEARSDPKSKVRAIELMANNYSIHYNVWTVDELLEFFLKVRWDFALPFRILSTVCCDNEVIVLLEKSSTPEHSNRPISSPELIPNPLNSNSTELIKMTAISSISDSESMRTNVKYPVWKHVIPIPPESLMWSVGGSSIEIFLLVGDAWAQLVSRYTPEKATVLDIGCGCGRTARVLINNRWIDRYIGFDIIRQNIEWCRRYIVPHWHGIVEFHWFDLYSGEYNPGGGLRAENLTFPCEDERADVIFGASLFTHLLEPDALHYLREIQRTLSSRGKALLSIHNNVPPGERYYGTETRIDIDPDYFVELAARAGLNECERLDDLGGQQVFVFQKLASS
jgi:SAM-dependent methyltransferase